MLEGYLTWKAWRNRHWPECTGNLALCKYKTSPHSSRKFRPQIIKREKNVVSMCRWLTCWFQGRDLARCSMYLTVSWDIFAELFYITIIYEFSHIIISSHPLFNFMASPLHLQFRVIWWFFLLLNNKKRMFLPFCQLLYLFRYLIPLIIC